jgi:signal transduction histidine kinase
MEIPARPVRPARIIRIPEDLAMSHKPLRIAIIGGGKRCEQILKVLEADRLHHLRAEVVAVADVNPEAPGFLKAKNKGIFTTRDYMEFFDLPDLELDLVIELTGNEQLLEDLIRHKPQHLRVLDLAMSRLCEDIVCFEDRLQTKEREVSLMRSTFRQLFSVVRDPIMVIEPDYTIVDANDSLLTCVGLEKGDVIGRKCYEISHRSIRPCGGPNHECPLREALRTRSSAHAVHEHHLSETQTRYYDIMAYPLTNEENKVEVVLEIWRDISLTLERQVMEKTRQIKEDLARLVHEDKMIALGKLVASSVHEINNPLAAIHTFGKVMLRMLKRSELEMSREELKEMEGFLELVCSESKRCGDIVSNLLSFSRLRPLAQRSFSLNEIMQKIVLLLKHKMDLQKIDLSTNLQPDIPSFHGDLSQIQQCIMNLILNAMEAMPQGGGLSLHTRHDPEKARLLIEVRDTGCGIAHDQLTKIFEPFFSTKSHDKGVGLGLAVVYGIIKEHGGEIEVESEVGAGSCFRVILPLDQGT